MCVCVFWGGLSTLLDCNDYRAAAKVNARFGLDEKMSAAIQEAADEVLLLCAGVFLVGCGICVLCLCGNLH